jgi:predicted CXXCH cytochrome family protein
MIPLRRFALASALGFLLVGAASSQDQCAACHASLDDAASKGFLQDIHRAKGLTCAACHGGDARSDDMEKAMSLAAGFVGVPKGDEISARCASCHGDAERMRSYGSKLPTDQWTDIQTSVHFRQGVTGREHIAQCTTCHGAHGIRRVTDPASRVSPRNIVQTCSSCHASAAYMRGYNPALPVDQREKYLTSVHGVKNKAGDTSVAECASCHGSHAIRSVTDARSLVYPTNLPSTCGRCHSDSVRMKPYGIPTDQFERYARSVHGKALLEKKDLGAPACNDCHGNHGATPPGITSISMVCGTCHALNAELFSASPHKLAFDRLRKPECETCHGNHEIVAATDQLLGVATDAVCSQCHTPTSAPKGYAAAQAMRLAVDSLEGDEAEAKRLVEEAEQKGMEVSEARFQLRDVRQARLEARTMVHAFNLDKFRDVTNKGRTAAATITASGQEALDEHSFRRVGFGISTGILTVLVVALAMYIRRLERRQAERRT